MFAASCPSCGAPLEFKNPASIYVVCESCETLSVRKDADLEALGKVAALKEDGSPVQIGTRGAYKGKRFEVVGRLQLDYGEGSWNEWFLSYSDGTSGWLGEAQGDYALSAIVPPPAALPAFRSIRPGQSISIGKTTFEVRDVKSARCTSGQGELPFEVRSGYDAPVVDLQGPSGLFATLDYSEEPPVVFTGEYVDFESLSLTDLREIEGW